MICLWTDKLPQEHRDAGDEQLLAAFAGGLGLADLAGLFAEMYVRARGDVPDQDQGREFADREVKLATTIGGAGVVHGDLTAECAAAVAAVLDALSAPAGKEDDRTKGQRYHDALQEAMRRLTAAGLLPERAGQPVKAWAHIALADLMRLDGQTPRCSRSGPGTCGRDGPTAARPRPQTGATDGATRRRRRRGRRVRRRDHAHRDRRRRHRHLEDPVPLCVELDRLRRDGDSPDTPPPTPPRPGRRSAGGDRQGRGPCLGPGGWRTSSPSATGGPLGGPSLPLDIGYSEPIPVGVRNAVMLRDQHCMGGGCAQPAGACEVHHTKHKANGGKTSVKDCVLLCPFHHQVVIHRWGWMLVVNPDGTTSAWNKDKTKTLHSHGPPARAG